MTLPEIDEFLTVVREHGRRPFLYPMVVAAADTGARRSELMRSEKRDVDFSQNLITLREKKRSRGKYTTRTVPLSDRVRAAMTEWFTIHNGSRYTFSTDRTKYGKLTVSQAENHFARTLCGTEWSVVRGWHVLRHSFASNCASSGIDQRIINAWMGHQTEEMVRRYQHLVPDVHQSAMRSLIASDVEVPITA